MMKKQERDAQEGGGSPRDSEGEGEGRSGEAEPRKKRRSLEMDKPRSSTEDQATQPGGGIPSAGGVDEETLRAAFPPETEGVVMPRMMEPSFKSVTPGWLGSTQGATNGFTPTQPALLSSEGEQSGKTPFPFTTPVPKPSAPSSGFSKRSSGASPSWESSGFGPMEGRALPGYSHPTAADINDDNDDDSTTSSSSSSASSLAVPAEILELAKIRKAAGGTAGDSLLASPPHREASPKKPLLTSPFPAVPPFGSEQPPNGHPTDPGPAETRGHEAAHPPLPAPQGSDRDQGGRPPNRGFLQRMGTTGSSNFTSSDVNSLMRLKSADLRHLLDKDPFGPDSEGDEDPHMARHMSGGAVHTLYPYTNAVFVPQQDIVDDGAPPLPQVGGV